jgi:hypothetical protein
MAFTVATTAPTSGQEIAAGFIASSSSVVFASFGAYPGLLPEIETQAVGAAPTGGFASVEEPAWFGDTPSLYSGDYFYAGTHAYSDNQSGQEGVRIAHHGALFVIDRSVTTATLAFQWRHTVAASFKEILLGVEDNIILLEVNGHDGANETTFYFSTGSYISHPGDSPSNTLYESLIRSIPNIRLDIGSSDFNWGEVELFNGSGELDAILLSHDFARRDFTLLIGQPCQPKSEFFTLLSGKTADTGLRASGMDKVTLGFHDKLKTADIPLNPNTITYATADGDEEANTPVCYGQVFNISPVYIGKDGDNNPVYKFHDGESESVLQVRDRGVILQADINYTVNLADSTITMLVPLDGEVTLDVKGAKRNGAWLSQTAPIIQDILIYRAGLIEQEIDAASFAAFAAAQPAVIGFYDEGGGKAFDAISSLLDSVGAYLSPMRNGQLRIGRLGDTSGEEKISLTQSDIRQDGLSQKDTGRPIRSILLGYNQNHTEQGKDGLGLSLYDEDMTKYAKPWSQVRLENTTPSFLAKYAGAESSSTDDKGDDKITETLLQYRADAETEAQRRITLYGVPYRDFDVSGYANVYELDVGDIVKLYHPRYGFASGKKGQVHSIDLDPLEESGVIGVRFYGV